MYMPSLFGENLFDEFFGDFARPVRREYKFHEPMTRIMKTDVRENDESFELAIELPGFAKDNITAELKDGFLTIIAEMKRDSENKEECGKYIRRERYTGKCSRSFYVGEDIKEEDIKARFESGILYVVIPKTVQKVEEEQRHLVAIEG